LPDTEAFIRWADRFQQKCQQLNCLSRAELLNFLANLKTHFYGIDSPKRIFFVGFDDYSPVIKSLQSNPAFLPGGDSNAVHSIQLAQSDRAQTTSQSFIDQEMELQAMARWAYQTLRAHPKATIGCVLPNLTETRNDLIRIFTDVYVAEGLSDIYRHPPFNISAGDRLYDFPMIQVALKILLLKQDSIDIEDLSYLLRTPFIKGAEIELHARAKLDVRIRSLGEKKIRVKYFLASENLRNFCPILYEALVQFLKQDKTANQALSDWVELFSAELNQAGWPGDRSLNSIEFQVLERFKKLLTEFCSLSTFLSTVSWQSAIDLLKQLTCHTLFQPKTVDTPIQILGILEASSILFDSLWVAGLHGENWPPPCGPNPFIPHELQKKLAMPHATSERELMFSLNITERFLQSANDVIFSYPITDNDRPLIPSPLIASYPKQDNLPDEWQSIEQQIFASKRLESFVDEEGPPVQLTENIMGGSGIIKSQAACPFQAFAQYRLRAVPIETTQIGLAPHEKGSLIHGVLAKIWQIIADHTSLCTLDDPQLSQIIAEAIEPLLLKLSTSKPSLLQGHLLLEQQRVQNIIFNWLQLERSRPPFQVSHCEYKNTLTLGPLTLALQIDRIDQLPDGSQLMIDYKTGTPSILDWFGERPDDPQLPLYALARQNNLSGILFAQIKTNKMMFKGLTALPDTVSGANVISKYTQEQFLDFESLIDSWQKILEQLANDFWQGKASVFPKQASSCQYCQLHELCRIAGTANE
jgi:probable DNA repair protein